MTLKNVPTVNTVTNIYSLSDPLSKQVRYIGKADNVKKRLTVHLTDTDKNHRTNWIKSLKKVGLKPEVDIIDIVSYNEWQFWERHYISLYKSWGFKLVNGTEGGDGTVNRKFSQETIEKIRQYRLSHPITKETAKKISEANKGKKRSLESKFRISESKMGTKNPNFGKKQSKEIIEKQVIARRGFKHSKETKEKMRISAIKREARKRNKI